MKKIIFTVTNDLVFDRRMLRICESLNTEGYEVWLVGRRLPNSPAFENSKIIGKRFRLFFNKGKFFYVEYNIRLFFWLIFQRFDAICGIDLDTILPCFFASKLKKKPCFYDAHELFTEVPEVISRPKVQRVWRAVEAYIVPKVTQLYTVSQSVADEFERRYGRKFAVIRNLPNRQTVDNQSFTNRKHVLLYQGNLNEGRGLETAIEAMQFLENIEFWIVGDGDLMPILRGLVQKFGVSEKVRFWGYISPAELPKITEQATIGLHISEDKGLSYRYSLGNKFLDYIQAQVPQICTQFIEYQRLNDEFDVAILIEKTDVSLLVAAVSRLLSDPIFYRKLKQNCAHAATILNWENEAKKLVDLYRNI